MKYVLAILILLMVTVVVAQPRPPLDCAEQGMVHVGNCRTYDGDPSCENYYSDNISIYGKNRSCIVSGNFCIEGGTYCSDGVDCYDLTYVSECPAVDSQACLEYYTDNYGALPYNVTCFDDDGCNIRVGDICFNGLGSESEIPEFGSSAMIIVVLVAVVAGFVFVKKK